MAPIFRENFLHYQDKDANSMINIDKIRGWLTYGDRALKKEFETGAKNCSGEMECMNMFGECKRGNDSGKSTVVCPTFFIEYQA